MKSKLSTLLRAVCFLVGALDLVLQARTLVPVEAALQIKLIGLAALGVVFRRLFLFPRNFELQFLDNLACYAALDREQVRHLAVVLLAPHLRLFSRIHKFDADRQVLAPLCDPTG